MSPLDQQKLLDQIGRLIDRKIDPVIERVSRLEGVDVNHERAIKDARRELTVSKHEIVASTQDALVAAARHQAAVTEQIEQKLDALSRETRTSIVPAALGAERTSHRVEGKTDALAVGQDQIEMTQRRLMRWVKIGAGLLSVVEGLPHILRALGVIK